MNFENFYFNLEQRRIAITVFRHEQSSKTVVIGPAIGVRSSFYHTIATYFHERGFNCVLFDYHGMFYEEAANDHSNIASFGKTDLTFVVDYCLSVLQSEELYFLGHSLSGQVLPLATNANVFKAAYLVASQSVDVTNWSGRSRVAVSIFWNLIIPLTTRAFQYLPPWAYGGKHRLAKSVARDWARLAKTRGGLATDTPYNKSQYQAFQVPTKFVSIAEDDLLAPKRAVTHLHHQYGSMIKDLYHIQANSSAKPLDHFSFFRKHNSHLWDDILLWFEMKHSFAKEAKVRIG